MSIIISILLQLLYINTTSTLLYFSFLYPILPLLYSILPFFTLFFPSLLYSSFLYSSLPSFTLFFLPLLHSSFLYSILPFFAPFHFTLFNPHYNLLHFTQTIITYKTVFNPFPTSMLCIILQFHCLLSMTFTELYYTLIYLLPVVNTFRGFDYMNVYFILGIQAAKCLYHNSSSAS